VGLPFVVYDVIEAMTSYPPASKPPLLLVGMPRSGSTWTMRALAADASLHGVMEPDNESRSASAIWAKRRAGRFPVLEPGDHDPEYHRLWEWILAGADQSPRLKVAGTTLRAARDGGRRRFYHGRFSPLMQLAGVIGAPPVRPPMQPPADQRLLVKTVHVPLAVEWLASEFDVEVLVLLRHPGNVLASWISLNLLDQFVRLDENPRIRSRMGGAGPLPPAGSEPLERMVWQIGVLTLALEDALSRNPTWQVRVHDALCVDPPAQFRRLYSDLGLTWNGGVEQYLATNDRPGVGFPTQRVASDQPDAWKSRLTSTQIGVMQEVLSRFPLSSWSAKDLTP
jgi:hypothetical protein